MQHQGHLGRLQHVLAYQIRQQIRRNGVDNAQTQSAIKRVFAAFDNFAYQIGLLKHLLRLLYHFVAYSCGCNFAGAALKEFDIQLVFQFAHRYRQGGLRHKA